MTERPAAAGRLLQGPGERIPLGADSVLFSFSFKSRRGRRAPRALLPGTRAPCREERGAMPVPRPAFRVRQAGRAGRRVPGYWGAGRRPPSPAPLPVRRPVLGAHSGTLPAERAERRASPPEGSPSAGGTELRFGVGCGRLGVVPAPAAVRRPLFKNRCLRAQRVAAGGTG